MTVDSVMLARAAELFALLSPALLAPFPSLPSSSSFQAPEGQPADGDPPAAVERNDRAGEDVRTYYCASSLCTFPLQPFMIFTSTGAAAVDSIGDPCWWLSQGGMSLSLPDAKSLRFPVLLMAVEVLAGRLSSLPCSLSPTLLLPFPLPSSSPFQVPPEQPADGDRQPADGDPPAAVERNDLAD